MVLGLRMNKIGMGKNNKAGNADELRTADFFSGTVNCVAGKWNDLGSFEVPAQQAYKFGHGDINHAPANQGYAYVFLKDDAGTPLEVPGKLRLVRTDANEEEIKKVIEKDAGVMHGSKTDVNQRLPLPLQNHEEAREDDKLMLKFMPDTTANVVAANSDIVISVTRY